MGMITDQAERLRRLAQRRALGFDVEFADLFAEKVVAQKRVIVFAGNEHESLACSNLVANIAVGMAKQQKRVSLLDAYHDQADARIPLGIHPRYTIEDVLNDRIASKEMYCLGAGNVRFIKLGAFLSTLEKQDFKVRNGFMNQWVRIEEESDIIIVNSAAGTGVLENTEVVIVTSQTQEAVTVAYEKIKQVSQISKAIPVGLIVNMCYTEKDAHSIYKRIACAAKRFLDLDIHDIGYVLLEPEVIKALKSKSPFVLKYPYSSSATQVGAIVRKMLAVPTREQKGTRG